MKAVLTFLTFLLISTQLYSQQLWQQWANRYNGPGNNADWAYALICDNSSNVYITGYSTGAGTGKDMFTVKYNPDGIPLWNARYNGPHNGGDYSFAIALDQAGNVYVTGRSDRGPSTLSDYTTIKYNNNGVQQWVALYDGPDHQIDEAISVYVDAGGNVFVTGKSYSLIEYNDVVTVKYNSSGVQQWVNRYTGTAHSEDVAKVIKGDASGNLYVAGSSVYAGFDFLLMKINPNGTTSWTKSYNGPVSGGDMVSDMKLDLSSGHIYITGLSYGGALTVFDYATLKYDLNGNQIWERRFNGVASRTDIANAMALDNNGNIFVTGTSLGNAGDIDSNFATIKYTPDGTHVWTAYYQRSGAASDVSKAIVTDADGNIYVTGNSGAVGQDDDFTTIKYDPNGVQQWILTYNGPDNDNDFSNAIAVDNNGYVYVSGRSFSQSGNYDFVTIKYSNLLGLNQSGTKVPDSYGLYQNYPNPFNPVTKIRFDLPESSNAQLVVYNSLGSVVFSENFGLKQAGEYEYTFDAANLFASGVYFYRLTAGDFTATKKMILIK